MQVFYDIALGLFLQSPSANNEITQLTAKRASNNPISLQFLNNGTPVNLPTGTQFIFGAKQSNGNNGGFYDDAYAVYVDNTGWTGPDENGFYNCQPGYNTTKLNSLFGYTYPNMDTFPHPDSVTLDGEISWLKPGDTLWSKTPYWQLLCYNDVSKGIEGVPTSGGPVYPSPSAIELIANKGIAGGYCPLGTDALVPISFLPIATGTSLGIMRVGSGLAVTAGVVSATGGGGSTVWISKTTNYTLIAGDKIIDSVGGLAFTLPAATGSGAQIEIIDGQGNWGSNASAIIGKINGDSGGVDLDISAGCIRLVDVGSATGWYAN